MTLFLSDEWLAEAAAALSALPELDGVDGTVQYVVTGAPQGKLQFFAAVRSGQVIDLAAGKAADPGCTVTLTYTDAVSMLEGELSPEVAFMSGRAKVEGDHRVWLLDLRPLRSSAPCAAARARIRASTTT